MHQLADEQQDIRHPNLAVQVEIAMQHAGVVGRDEVGKAEVPRSPRWKRHELRSAWSPASQEDHKICNACHPVVVDIHAAQVGFWRAGTPLGEQFE